MSEQISCGFLIRIYVWAELIKVLINQKTVTQIWFWWYIGCLDCPNINLRSIKVTVEPTTDLLYIKSPDDPYF